MANIKEFRRVNNLQQQELASYLKVSASYLSNVEKGRAALSPAKLEMLMNNDKGWDTAPLYESEGKTIVNNYKGSMGDNSPVLNVEGSDAVELIRLRTENEMLRSQLETERNRADKYWEMIEKLTK